MAKGDRSMATYRPGQKRSRLFARLNPNFSSGRYAPPSKNRAQQSRLFRTQNPYAQDSRVMMATGDRSLGMPTRTAQPVGMGVMGPQLDPTRTAAPVGSGVMGPTMGAIGQPAAQGPYGPAGLNPEAQAAYSQFGQGSQISDIMRAQFGGGQRTAAPVGGGVPGPAMGGNLAGLQGLAGLSPEDLAAVQEIGASGQMNTANPEIANAARLQAMAMRNNPFITREGLLQMARGFVPTEQQINPAFYRYTSPVIQQSLAGLRQSVGYRPEEQSFIQQQFTPMSLR